MRVYTKHCHFDVFTHMGLFLQENIGTCRAQVLHKSHFYLFLNYNYVFPPWKLLSFKSGYILNEYIANESFRIRIHRFFFVLYQTFTLYSHLTHLFYAYHLTREFNIDKASLNNSQSLRLPNFNSKHSHLLLISLFPRSMYIHLKMNMLLLLILQ